MEQQRYSDSLVTDDSTLLYLSNTVFYCLQCIVGCVKYSTMQYLFILIGCTTVSTSLVKVRYVLSVWLICHFQASEFIFSQVLVMIFFYKRKLLSTFFPEEETSLKDICFTSPFAIRSPSTALTCICICTYTVIKSIFLYSSPAFYSGSITRSNVMTSMLRKLSS